TLAPPERPSFPTRRSSDLGRPSTTRAGRAMLARAKSRTEEPMPTPETYEILAVKYGEMTKRTRADNFMHPDDHAAPMPIDYFVFVIRNDKRTILVDTGFDRKEAAARGRAITNEPLE